MKDVEFLRERHGTFGVIVYITKGVDELADLKEAARILQREVLKYESDIDKRFHW